MWTLTREALEQPIRVAVPHARPTDGPPVSETTQRASSHGLDVGAGQVARAYGENTAGDPDPVTAWGLPPARIRDVSEFPDPLKSHVRQVRAPRGTPVLAG